MRVEINLDRCLNSGQCGYMHPELFEVDDDGVPTLLVTGQLEEDQRSKAQQAADSCPSQSIMVVEG